MKRVCCYIRVSTLDQSTDMQRTDLERYCELYNLEAVFFEDYGSGRSMKKRPALADMMVRIGTGEFKECIIWKIDRINRNLRDFLSICEEMESNNVRLVSFKDNIDFSTPIGRMFSQLLGVFSEFESANISARVKSGMAEKKRQGSRFGAKPMKFPIKQARLLERAGLTRTDIAKELGVGRTTVCKYMSKVRQR